MCERDIFGNQLIARIGHHLHILGDTAALASTCVARINDDTRRIESDTHVLVCDRPRISNILTLKFLILM